MPKEQQQRDISMIYWPSIDSHRSVEKAHIGQLLLQTAEKTVFVGQYIGKRHTRCSLRQIVNDRTTALL